MAFCTNCGSEIPEGIKFCANCGAPVGSDENKNTNASVDAMHEQPEGTQQADTGRQPEGGEVPGGDKYGKFIGIGLLILAIVNLATDPPILTILLSAAIIGGAIVCLAKKYKLKGFPIAAIVLAASCLLAGVTDAQKYGMFHTSGKDTVVENESEEQATPLEQVTAGPSATNDGTGAEQLNPREDSEQIDGNDPNPTAVADTEKDKDEDEDVTGSSGVDPDLKEFLDSYEKFVDEYVAFMKKYLADPNNAVSMLTEYTEMMGKYIDFAKKIDQYDSKEMSTEDAKYFLEVTTRCTQKMLDLESLK